MPFITVSTLPVREIFPGLRARLIHTDRQTHSWVEVDAGASFPEHQHPHEQIVSVIEGELELTVQGTTHRLTPGAVYVIPPEAGIPAAASPIAACSMSSRRPATITASVRRG